MAIRRFVQNYVARKEGHSLSRTGEKFTAKKSLHTFDADAKIHEHRSIRRMHAKRFEQHSIMAIMASNTKFDRSIMASNDLTVPSAKGSLEESGSSLAKTVLQTDKFVEKTVRQVLHDLRTDDREEYSMDVSTQLIDSILRTMDYVDVEHESYMDQSTTSSAAQNLVDDWMEDIWTDQVPADVPPHGSIITPNSQISDMAKDFVANVLLKVY